MNSIFLDALEVDAERVESVNQLLRRCGPAPIEGFRPVRLLVLRPSRDLGKLAAGFSGRLPWFLQWMCRGLGAEQSRSPDFLSYLLFHPSFVDLVAELGYEDTLNRWSEIEPFLEEGGF